MRIKFEFEAEKIPIQYHMLFVSVFKEALKGVNVDYYENLYQFHEGRKNKKIKNFTFGVYIKGYDIEEELFIVKDKVIVIVSSPDYEFMINLHNGIMEKRVFKYKDFTIKNTKIIIMQENKLTKDEAIFSTLSPIAIRSREGKFLNVDDENYIKELNYIANLMIESYRGYGLTQELKFQSISYNKVVVKQEISAFKEKTNKKFLFVNAYKGLFKLQGDKEDLNLIYQMGLGFRRSEGMGCLTVIE